MEKNLLVINLRGTINAPSPVREALKRLRIPKRHMATIVQGSIPVLGLLKRVKHHAAWCVADEELVEDVLKRRGRIRWAGPIDKKGLKSLGFTNLSSFAKAIAQDGKDLKEIDGIIPYFRLGPPKGGFRKSLRRMASQGGVLGENPELGKLIREML